MDNKINTNDTLQSVLQTNPNREKRELEKAASEFEALFIHQMLKTMRKSVDKGSLFGNSKGEEIYKSMLDEELSKVMAQGKGMGLREMVVRDLRGIDGREEKEGASEEMASPSVDGAGGVEMGRPATSGATLMDGQERLPVKGDISSLYGFRKDSVTGEVTFHHGIDISAAEGSPVSAVAGGVVRFSGTRADYGNLVEVAHDDGSLSIYGHNRENMVAKGERVELSDIIAHVGKSGRAPTPHLHFEIRVDGFSVNPAEMLSLVI
ncbi:MAG: peptidoglycan DD-metalloendopeptidase family protein [Thermodesulfobacteriota bacterium]